MEAAIAGAAEAGAEWIELAFIGGYVDFSEADFDPAPARDLGARIAGAGLRVHAVSAHMDLGDPRPETDAMLARRLRFAASLGARFLISNAGLAARSDAICRRIEAALPLCHAAGVVLALENPGHGSGALIRNAVDGAALVRGFDDPALRLNYDAGNAYSYSGGSLQPAADVGQMADTGLIGHLHVKDLRQDGDGWRFCAAGDGLVDYAPLWPLLPVDMPLSLELPLRLTRPGRGDPARQSAILPYAEIVAAVRRSLAFVAIGRPSCRAGK